VTGHDAAIVVATDASSSSSIAAAEGVLSQAVAPNSEY